MSDLDDLQKDLRAFADALRNQEMLNELGLAAEKRIRDRTREGRSVSGSKFDSPADEKIGDYSASHARRRQEKGLDASPINLEFSLYDGMLSQKVMTYDVASDLDGVTLYFDDEEKAEIASYITEKGIGTSGVTYDFFGLNEEDQEAISEIIDDHFTDALDLADLT
jgi:hypothetical protein